MRRQEIKRVLEEIAIEMEELKRTVHVINKRYKEIKSGKVDAQVYIESIALNLHAFYSGIEEGLKSIADLTGEGLPGGQDWHAKLLRLMARPLNRVRPAVLSKKTFESIAEFKSFRHVARVKYPFMLDGDLVLNLCRKVNKAHKDFIADIAKFTLYVKKELSKTA